MNKALTLLCCTIIPILSLADDQQVNNYNQTSWYSDLKYQIMGGTTIIDRSVSDGYYKYSTESATQFYLGVDKPINNKVDLGISYFHQANGALSIHPVIYFLQTISNYYTSEGLLLNITYNFSDIWYFTPYIRGSIGFSENDNTHTEYSYFFPVSYTNNNYMQPAYGAALGSKVNISKSFKLLFEYKYMDLGKVKSSYVERFGSPPSTYNIISTKYPLRQNFIMAGFELSF